VLALYEAGAHLVLGYPSWGEYAADRFGLRRATAYRLLEVGRAARVLHDAGLPAPGTQAMAHLVGTQPDPAAAWRAVLEAHGEQATVAQARALLAPTSAAPPAGPRLLPREEAEAIALGGLKQLRDGMDAVLTAFKAKDRELAKAAADQLDAIDLDQHYDAMCSMGAWWSQAAGEAVLRAIPWGHPESAQSLYELERAILTEDDYGRWRIRRDGSGSSALVVNRLKMLPPVGTLRLMAHYGAPVEDYLAMFAVERPEAI